MQYLWFLLAPVGVFVSCSLGVAFFKLSDTYRWDREWWWFPAWMVFGCCFLAPIMVGSVLVALGMVFG